MLDKDILIMGDINLPDADWNMGTVICPMNSRNNKFIMQQDMMDCFLENGLHWYLREGAVTRLEDVWLETNCRKPCLTRYFAPMIALFAILTFLHL